MSRKDGSEREYIQKQENTGQKPLRCAGPVTHHVQPTPAPSALSVIVSITTPLLLSVSSLLLPSSGPHLLDGRCLEAAEARLQVLLFTGKSCGSCCASPSSYLSYPSTVAQLPQLRNHEALLGCHCWPSSSGPSHRGPISLFSGSIRAIYPEDDVRRQNPPGQWGQPFGVLRRPVPEHPADKLG